MEANKLKFLLLLITLYSSSLLANSSYFATENGNKIEVILPNGKKKIIFGELNLPGMGNYRIELPLKTLEDPFEIKESVTVKEPITLREPTKETREDESPKIQEEGKKSQTKLVVEYDNTDRLVVEANYLFNQGRYYEATIYVEELLRKNPEFSQAWAMKGSLLYVQGYKDLAKKAYDQALKLDPNNDEVKEFLKRLE